jgi:hypothetical protein
MVTVKAPSFNRWNHIISKTVPYSEDNYGKFIDSLKAYDAKGNLLLVNKVDTNSWSISKAKTLDNHLFGQRLSSTLKKVGFGQDDVFRLQVQT